MNEVLRYILISYIAVISLISAVVCIADKHNSKIKGRRRVPEKTLLILSALKEPCRVTLTSDSKYLTDAITKGWVYSWKKKGWKKSDGKAVLNPDLWEKLMSLLALHDVTFVWVKGHAGHPYNERCDAMAQNESGKYGE